MMMFVVGMKAVMSEEVGVEIELVELSNPAAHYFVVVEKVQIAVVFVANRLDIHHIDLPKKLD